MLVAALVSAMAVGMTCMGGAERVLEKFTWMLAGREQTQINLGENIDVISSIKEEEIYQEIEDEYGIIPVRMTYLPAGVDFLKGKIGTEIQRIDITYGHEDKVDIAYCIRPNYRRSSLGTDVEDVLINEYVMHVDNVEILIQEYEVEGIKYSRWTAEFSHQDVYYLITAIDMDKDKFEKIVESLYFG